MDEKKQIEEMTLEIAKLFCNPKGCYNCNLCDEYGSLELSCEDYLSYRRMASVLYAAGYRKQSVGEWKTADETNNHKVVECTNCKEQFYFAKKGQLQIDRMPHCPNCGAKMKGE